MWCKTATMNKIVFLLFFLLALAALSFVMKEKENTVEISSPVLAGSPLLVLNR